METPTLSFDEFWNWLMTHPNCIVRAGTPQAVLYDDEDLYWHFATEGPGTVAVQVLRGKRLLGELLIESEQVDYVQSTPAENEEYLFELISETEKERKAICFFALSHAYEAETTPLRRVH